LELPHIDNPAPTSAGAPYARSTLVVPLAKGQSCRRSMLISASEPCALKLTHYRLVCLEVSDSEQSQTRYCADASADRLMCQHRDQRIHSRLMGLEVFVRRDSHRKGGAASPQTAIFPAHPSPTYRWCGSMSSHMANRRMGHTPYPPGDTRIFHLDTWKLWSRYGHGTNIP
jgi:hypothetical protein